MEEIAGADLLAAGLGLVAVVGREHRLVLRAASLDLALGLGPCRRRGRSLLGKPLQPLAQRRRARADLLHLVRQLVERGQRGAQLLVGTLQLSEELEVPVGGHL